MLSSILNPEDIKLNIESEDWEEALAELLETIVVKRPGANRAEMYEALIARENKMSTAVFPGVAIPHAVSKSLNKSAIVIGVSKKGVYFDNPDKSIYSPVKVNVIFEVLFEENNTDKHLHVLRDILNLISNPDFVSKVLLASNTQEVLKLINSIEM